MKKLFISLATVLVLSLAFTSCKKDENTDPKDKKDSEQTTPTQKITKNLKITGLYIPAGSKLSNLNNIPAQPIPAEGYVLALNVYANFVNDGPSQLEAKDSVFLQVYVNDKKVQGEVGITGLALGVGAANGKVVSLFQLAVTPGMCAEATNKKVAVGIEVVRVNKEVLHNKNTSYLALQ